MDYGQIRKHIECKEYLHNLTTILEVLKIFEHDISEIQYTEDYRNRLHIDHPELNYRMSFYKRDEMDDDSKLYNNFVMRNNLNGLYLTVEQCSDNINKSPEFDFCDIRNETVELCNKLIENYNKDK